jgi:3-oxoacyl-[acyl-carrier-protein] synthase III
MLAHDLISNGRYKTVMVISSNMPSSQLRSEYYNQKLVKREQVLLRWFMSDGAGCMIFTRDDETRPGNSYLEASYVESVGCGYPPIMYDQRPSYSLNPIEVYEKGLHHIIQSGTSMQDTEERYHLLSTVFMEGLDRMAKQFDIDLTKTTYFQINIPSKHVYDFIKEKCTSIGVPEDAYYAKLGDYGYAGAPMVLITMDKLFTEENLKPGEQILTFVTEVSKIMQGGFMFRHY